ncbi:MAG: hypothetical protein R3B70_34480 [Polyangiaceae bacterium]
MRRLLFAQLTLEDLQGIAKLDDRGLRSEPWETFARTELVPEEQRVVDYVSADLRRFQPSLVNEATVFARAIYPLLVLAECPGVQALAAVPIAAQVGEVELAGTADGAMGRAVAGELRAPFLVLVEAKRGVEGTTPVPQLYGELLAAACLNAQETGRSSQVLYGCYTVADDWTFVEMRAEALDTPHPSASIVTSWELNEKAEAGAIARILKAIVAAHQRA